MQNDILNGITSTVDDQLGWSFDRSLTSLLLLPPLPPLPRPTARLPCEPSKRFYVTLSITSPLSDQPVDDRLREKLRIECETNKNEHLIR